MKKYHIYIFLIFLLLTGMSCGVFKKTPPPPPALKSLDIRIAEERFKDALLKYLNVNEADTPRKFADRRRIFEKRLNEYMQITGFQKQIEVEIERNGIKVKLPLEVLEVGYLATEKFPEGTIMTIGELQDYDFSGELVDMSWYPYDNESPYQLGLLFQDSLVNIWWPDDDIPMNTMRFPQAALEREYPAYPTGFINFTEKAGGAGVEGQVLTSGLRRSFVFQPGDQQVTIADSIDNIMPDSGLAVAAKEKRRYFPLSLKPDEIGYSIRAFDNNRRLVWSDSNGYVSLYSQAQSKVLWRSEIPLGERLFLLNDDLLAICNQYQHFFYVYRLQENALTYIGRSPRFEGSVCGVLYTPAPDEGGYLVAIRSGYNGGIPQIRLRFVEERDFRWDISHSIAAADLPKASGSIDFMQSGDFQFSLNSYYSIPAATRYHLFETILRLDEHGLPVKLLAKLVEADSSFQRWKIRLRNDVRFTDGNLLTTEEVLRSWQINWRSDLKHAPTTRWVWECIDGAEAYTTGKTDTISGIQLVDESTMIITLNRPGPDFEKLLSRPAFRIVKREKNQALGTGPFQIDKIEHTNGGFWVKCRRNTFYHLGQPPLASLNFYYGKNDLTGRTFLKGAKGTIVNSREDIKFFQQLPEFKLISAPGSKIYFLALNGNNIRLSDREFRNYIVTKGLAKEEIAGNITEGICIPVNRFFYNGVAHTPVTQTMVGRITQPLRIHFREKDPISRQIAERLSARLSQLGIPAFPPRGIADPSWLPLLESGEYDLVVDCYAPVFQSPLHDLIQMVKRGYRIPDDIKMQLLETLETVNGSGAVIERMLIQTAFFSPLFVTKSYLVIPERFKNVHLKGENVVDFSKTWLPGSK